MGKNPAKSGASIVARSVEKAASNSTAPAANATKGLSNHSIVHDTRPAKPPPRPASASEATVAALMKDGLSVVEVPQPHDAQDSKRMLLEKMLETLPFTSSKSALGVLDSIIHFADWALVNPSSVATLAEYADAAEKDEVDLVSRLMGTLYENTIASLTQDDRRDNYGDISRDAFVKGESYGAPHMRRLERAVHNLVLMKPAIDCVKDAKALERSRREHAVYLETVRIGMLDAKSKPAVIGLDAVAAVRRNAGVVRKPAIDDEDRLYSGVYASGAEPIMRCKPLNSQDYDVLDKTYKKVRAERAEIVGNYNDIVTEAEKWMTKKATENLEKAQHINDARKSKSEMQTGAKSWIKDNHAVELEHALKAVPCRQHFYNAVVAARGGSKRAAVVLATVANAYVKAVNTLKGGIHLTSPQSWPEVLSDADGQKFVMVDREKVSPTRAFWDALYGAQNNDTKKYLDDWQARTESARKELRQTVELRRNPTQHRVANVAHSAYGDCIVDNPSVSPVTMQVAAGILVHTRKHLRKRHKKDGGRRMPADHESALRAATMVRSLANFQTMSVRTKVPASLRGQIPVVKDAREQEDLIKGLIDNEASQLLGKNAAEELVTGLPNVGKFSDFVRRMLRVKVQVVHDMYREKYMEIEKLVSAVENCAAVSDDYKVDFARFIEILRHDLSKEQTNAKFTIPPDLVGYLEEYPTAESAAKDMIKRIRRNDDKLMSPSNLEDVQKLVDEAVLQLRIPPRMVDSRVKTVGVFPRGVRMVESVVAEYNNLIMRETALRYAASLSAAWKTGRCKSAFREGDTFKVDGITYIIADDHETGSMYTVTVNGNLETMTRSELCNLWSTNSTREVEAGTQVTIRPWTSPKDTWRVKAHLEGSMYEIEQGEHTKVVYRQDIRTEGEKSGLANYRGNLKVQSNDLDGALSKIKINVLEDAVLERIRTELGGQQGDALEFLNTWGSDYSLRRIRNKILNKDDLCDEEKIINDVFLNPANAFTALAVVETLTHINQSMLQPDDPVTINLAMEKVADIIMNSPDLTDLQYKLQSYTDQQCEGTDTVLLDKVIKGAYNETYAVGHLLAAIMDCSE